MPPPPSCTPSTVLYNMLVSLFFLSFLSNPTLLITSHGQLLPIMEEDRIQTYIVHVLKPGGRHELLGGDEGLENWHRSFLSNTTLDSGASRLVYSYRHAISGFAARLTSAEVRAMQAMDGFLYAHPSNLYRLQTTYTPEYLGLSQPFTGSWAGTMYGEGIIIGVIDSGIVPTHPSFDDTGMPPPPLRWKGNCSFPGFTCNNKIIGAKGFYNGTNASPMDDHGHGTHVASTAAGNFVDDTSVLGNAKGRASGMAPRAHLAIYKVCSADGTCDGADITAAIEQAIKDGVDVISMSLGANHHDKFYDDEVALSSLAAFKKGISPCTAAGNDGPKKGTLGHSAPWVLTVGASTTDRRISVIVKLGNGVELHGESGFQPRHFNSSAYLPIEFPGGLGDIEASYCLNGSLDYYDVVGKIVLCWSTVNIEDIEKGKVVYDAGAAAMIVMNKQELGYTTFSDAHVLPAAHVSNRDSQRLEGYVYLSRSTPTAALVFNKTQFGFGPSPAVASFSSRGPSEINGDIVKPDVLAPGVNILAAWPSEVGPDPTGWNTKTFNFISGTSMAAPHVSGIIALVRYKHRGWSPAAIQSALITSSRDLDLDGNAIVDEHFNGTANIYATGAGQVNPGGAMDPGLIYDLTHDDYIAYLCGLGYNDTEVTLTIGRQARCSTYRVTSPSQLNYPSIAMSMGSIFQIQTVERTVTNVGLANEIYRARIQEPNVVRVYLSTYELRFSRVGQQKSFNVTLLMRKSPGRGMISGGRLTWESNKHVVASPIAVRFK